MVNTKTVVTLGTCSYWAPIRRWSVTSADAPMHSVLEPKHYRHF